jgi:predicted O-methyltransferase YrrM
MIGIDDPESQVTRLELDLICRYARNAQTVCEIGCFEGKTTAALARSTSGTVFSVDPFFKGRVGISYTEKIAGLHCKRQRAENVVFLRGFSVEVARVFEHSIDFLFIDADHRYEAVVQDWASWVPKVRTNGIIALHDCKLAKNSPEYVGSMRFYDTDVPKYPYVKEVASVDSLVVLQVQ